MHPIETPRLILRAFVESDLTEFRQVVEIDLNWWGSVGTLEESKQRLQERMEWWYSPGSPLGYRAIILKESKVLIGLAGLLAAETGKPTLDFLNAQFPEQRPPYSNSDPHLGYGIGSQYRRRGYAAEAGVALIAHGFDSHAYPRIMSETSSENIASINVMKRVGMTVHPIPRTPESWSNEEGIYYPGWVGVIERSAWVSKRNNVPST
jgi:RimJ/RimL family protein N-acetyltransferase